MNFPLLDARRRAAQVLLFLMLGVGAGARAGTHIWTGAGGNALWSNAANWDTGTPPATGETDGTQVIFGPDTTSIMDIQGLVLDYLAFEGGGSTVSGGAAGDLGFNGHAANNTVECGPGSNTLEANLGLSLAGTTAVMISVNTGTLTFKGPVHSQAASPGLVVANFLTGSLVLAAANDYAGTTTVKKGVLLLSHAGAVPGDLIISSGGTARLAVNQPTATTMAVVINGSGVLDVNGFQETMASLTGTGVAQTGTAGNLKIDGGSGSLTFDGTLQGTGTFTKLGTGTLSLTGSKTGTSSFVVAAGELDLGGISWGGLLQVGTGTGAAGSARAMVKTLSLDTGSPLVVLGDGLLNLGGFGVFASTLSITDGTVELAGAVLNLNSVLTLNGGSITSSNASGRVMLGAGIVATSTAKTAATISAAMLLGSSTRSIRVNAGITVPEVWATGMVPGPELTISGVLEDGPGQYGLVKSGTGELRLTGAGNLYTGTTTVEEGLLSLLSTQAGGYVVPGPLVIGNDEDAADTAVVREDANNSLGASTTVQLNGSGKLDCHWHAEAVNSLNGTGHLALTGFIVGFSSSVLSVGGSGGGSEFNGLLDGGGSLHQVGGGIFRLACVNGGFTGDLYCSSGWLLVDCDLEDVRCYATGSGTLGGTGKVIAITLTGSSARVAPGGLPLPGVLHSHSATLGGAATLAVRIDDSAGQYSDELSITGTLDISGSSTLLLNVGAAPARNAYIIATYGTLNGGPFGTVFGLPAGYQVDYEYSDGGPLMHIALVRTHPPVLTVLASNVLATSAVLHGTVNEVTLPSTTWFQYGLTAQYGLRTPAKPWRQGDSPFMVIPIARLSPGQTYHFQAVLSNSGGTVYGEDRTFITAGPQAVTRPASAVSALSATVNGSLITHGRAVTLWFDYGPGTAYGSRTAVQRLPDPSSSFPGAALTKLKPNTLYHYRVTASDGVNTVHGDDATFTTLLVLPPVIATAGQPQSGIVTLGGGVFFQVIATEASPQATDSPLTYQWSLNGVPIRGATYASYGIYAVVAAQAGTYTCKVGNAAGSLTSAPARLVVVDHLSSRLRVAQGGSATLTVHAAGPGLAYQWMCNGAPVSGATAATLKLTSLHPTADGDYCCVVSGAGGSQAGGTTTLAVYTGAPRLVRPVTLPVALVGGEYSFQLPVDGSSNVAPTRYAARLLPAGLAMNTATGVISGRPDLRLPVKTDYLGNLLDTAFQVTLSASNDLGTDSVTVTLTVWAYPEQEAGTYCGLLNRDAPPAGTATVNGGLGGIVTLTSTRLGAFTARAVVGGATLVTTGQFLPQKGVIGLMSNNNLLVNPNGTRPALKQVLNMTINSYRYSGMNWITGEVRNAGTDVATTFAAQLQQNVYDDLPGTYTARVGLASPALVGTDPATSPAGNPANAAYPQGFGYATVTISATGGVTWIGKMADGTGQVAVYSTVLLAGGNFAVHLALAPGASAQGLLTATSDTLGNNDGLPLLDGTLDWVKHGSPAPYAAIPLCNVTVAGGQYVAPAQGTPVLGLVKDIPLLASNASLAFTEGGLASAAYGADLATCLMRITPANIAALTLPMTNPASLGLSLVAKTAAMSGGFTLKDGAATRKVTYSGLLVTRLDVNAGVGFFLLPGLSGGPTLSGGVVLKKN